MFVAAGFALHNVLDLARGDREWREILIIKTDAHAEVLFAITIAPLLPIGVGFSTCAYLAGVESAGPILAFQFTEWQLWRRAFANGGLRKTYPRMITGSDSIGASIKAAGSGRVPTTAVVGHKVSHKGHIPAIASNKLQCWQLLR
jgi:hypothetical protein